MRVDLNIGNVCATSRGCPSGSSSSGTLSENADAMPGNAFSAPGPYCMAKTAGGLPFAVRAKPAAMSTPTRSCRQMMGRSPAATAASMIGVVG